VVAAELVGQELAQLNCPTKHRNTLCHSCAAKFHRRVRQVVRDPVEACPYVREQSAIVLQRRVRRCISRSGDLQVALQFAQSGGFHGPVDTSLCFREQGRDLATEYPSYVSRFDSSRIRLHRAPDELIEQSGFCPDEIDSLL
jgi:hypothetical protein